MKRLIFIMLALSVSGCTWIGRQADALGGYMPVVGERCEHWQCLTKSGQERSEEIKKEQEQAKDMKPLLEETETAKDKKSAKPAKAKAVKDETSETPAKPE